MMARALSVCLYKPSAASVRIIGWEATAKVTLSSIVSQLNLVSDQSSILSARASVRGRHSTGKLLVNCGK